MLIRIELTINMWVINLSIILWHWLIFCFRARKIHGKLPIWNINLELVYVIYFQNLLHCLCVILAHNVMLV